jgi:hypothetical protein
MADGNSDSGNWMAGSVSKPGSFSRSAHRAGESTMQYARQKREAPGLLGKRARLALTFNKFRPGSQAKSSSGSGMSSSKSSSSSSLAG